MGTSGLVGFRHRGVKKAVYNHWDSHPSGLGQAVVDFIREIAGDAEKVAQFLAQLDEVTWVEEEGPKPSKELQGT
jgi:hypothetical protein